MTPLFFSIDGRKRMMVQPDVQQHMDGHPILTYTYSLFKDNGMKEPQQSQSKAAFLHLRNVEDPDYYGFITFEKPGGVFTYTANGNNELSSEEVNELIEQISHMRDNPVNWKEN